MSSKCGPKVYGSKTFPIIGFTQEVCHVVNNYKSQGLSSGVSYVRVEMQI
jgi:hypothetical protein